MFCHNCGKELPDGSKFCSVCGEKQVFGEPAVPAVAAAPVGPAVPENPAPPVVPVAPMGPAASGAPAVPAVAAAPVGPAASGAPAVPVQPAAPIENGNFAAAVPAAPEQPAGSGAAVRKKKSGGKVIAGIAAAVLVVVAAAAGLGIFFFGSGDDNVYVYLSDGKYELITNLGRGQSIEIASSKTDTPTEEMLAFSPDGKYLYYYTRVNHGLIDTGTLCRAEYGKLKQNGRNNDRYIETIADNVLLGFQLMDDGSVLYKSSDWTLFYFNGEDSVRIAKDVGTYRTDGAGRLIYITGNIHDGEALYGVLLSDIDNTIELAPDIDSLCNTADFDHILYAVVDLDYSPKYDYETLYTVGFEKPAEKLAEHVYHMDMVTVGEKTYFTAEDGETLCLYDYVEDPYAEADAGKTEPREEDFLIPQYDYEMLSGQDLSEGDYEELYTSCTRSLYLYGEDVSLNCSMEEALDITWTENSDQVHAATQRFIDRFGDTADENGFILVTDEVKAALKEIQSVAGDPSLEWQWMWLCYSRYQSGTETDKAYWDAKWEWDEVSLRIDVRNALQDPTNGYTLRTLYCFENGELTTIQENVPEIEEHTGAIVFNTMDLVGEETIKIDDVFMLGTQLYTDYPFELDYGKENYVLLLDSNQVCRMSPETAQTFEEAHDIWKEDFYITDTKAYMNVGGGGALFVFEVSDGLIGDFSAIADEALVLEMNGSTLYYLNDLHQSEKVPYGDLYACTDGESTCLAKDVINYQLSVYEDGTVLAYTGYSRGSGYELSMFGPNGEETKIADHVSQYLRVDERLLLYISDGDLYSYNGREKTLVSDNAGWIWSKNAMEPVLDMRDDSWSPWDNDEEYDDFLIDWLYGEDDDADSD